MAAEFDYIIVGAGVTSVWAAQNIRENDSTGTIVIIGDEEHPPYDRPPLSKGMLAKDDMAVDDPYTKFDDFYPKHNIELKKSTRVTKVDRTAKTIATDGGETLSYGKLLLCTGSRVKTLDIPGGDLPNVFYLRHIADALKIREALQKAKSVAVVGGGYIGLETGASARTRGLAVTLIERESHPWAKFGSERFGKFMQGYYEKQGVKFLLNDTATAIAQDGDALKITTTAGQTVTADVVLIGVGVTLNTELAAEAGLTLGNRGGVEVSEFLQTSDPNIWAAGDIALFNDLALGKRWHAEHHLNGKWQGQAVGKIMAGGTEPYDRIPYFFSDEFDIHMVLRGDPNGGKNALLVGDLEGAEFAELYHDDSGRMTMGLAISHDEKKLDEISDTLEALLRKGVNLKGREAEIQAPGFDLNTL